MSEEIHAFVVLKTHKGHHCVDYLSTCMAEHQLVSHYKRLYRQRALDLWFIVQIMFLIYTHTESHLFILKMDCFVN